MNASYSSLESVMANIYNNPNMSNEEILVELGNVAKSMIYSQLAFTDTYENSNQKVTMMQQLEDKQNALENGLSQIQVKSK